MTAAIAHEKSRDVEHVLTIAALFMLVGSGKCHCEPFQRRARSSTYNKHSFDCCYLKLFIGAN